jgi:hypothetical protein
MPRLFRGRWLRLFSEDLNDLVALDAYSGDPSAHLGRRQHPCGVENDVVIVHADAPGFSGVDQLGHIEPEQLQ